MDPPVLTPELRRPLALAILLVVVIAVTLGVLSWLSPGSDPDGLPEEAMAAVPDVPAASIPAPAPATAEPQADQALLQRRPAGDSRLADLLPRLQALADAGDRDAACRLSVQLLSCQNWQAMFPETEASLAEQERKAQAEGRLDDADRMASMLLRITLQRHRCEGVASRDIEGASAYLRQAALAGQVEARVRYASGHGLGHHGNSRFISSEHFEHWRREALPMIEQLLAEGRPEAILLLLEAHSTNGGRLSLLMPADPVTSVAAMALARRVFGDQPAFHQLQMAAGLDAAQRAEAEALAASLHEQHFGNRRHPYEPATRTLRPLFDPYGLHAWPLSGASMEPREACLPSTPREGA